MKATDKINGELLRELLEYVGVEQGKDDKIRCYCHGSEQSFDLLLQGNQLKHL